MSINILKNVLLAPYTTFKIGGPAKFFVEVSTKVDLEEALQWARNNKQNLFILGGGSNLLISDKGFDGLIIRINNKKYKIVKQAKNFVDITCGSGVGLAGLALRMTKENLSGLEWSVGIPRATVGGAVRGNAEAFGVAMNDLIQEVEIFDLKKRKFKRFDNTKCQFHYRESIFKKNKDYLIWSATLRLAKQKKEIIEKLIRKSIEHRKNNYPKLSNAGSVFKNTIPFKELKKHNKEVADYAIKNRIVSRLGNVSAGFLIDYFGLKGKQIGGAKISEEHGNFIVNTGNATAEDVIILISLIKQKIRDNFGIQLEEEIQLIGF